MTDATVPDSTRALHSIVLEEGAALLVVGKDDLAAPGPEEVVVRVEAAPINPSDLGLLFAGGDIGAAEATEHDGAPALRIPLGRGALAANAARFGRPMPAGNEGGGTVVAAGSSDAAQALLGRVVGFASGNAYAGYRTVHVESCIAMPDGVTPEQAAAPFVNPMTALGMVETMRMDGHTGLVHTVGASNLGLMLHRICLADGVPLVNLVRRAEHVELLRSQGAEHVVDTSTESFRDDLRAALEATGATLVFDAIGGGVLVSDILATMERIANDGAEFSRYGTGSAKQAYIYGNLDPSPTTVKRTFGFAWSIGGWLLLPFLARLGSEGAARLRARVADEIATTFASRYGMRVALDEVVDLATAQRYGAMASGDKALVVPHA